MARNEAGYSTPRRSRHAESWPAGPTAAGPRRGTMMAMRPERIVPLLAAQRRRPSPEQRVVYALAGGRVALPRGPSPRLAHLVRARD
jgi:hypothetical protein